VDALWTQNLRGAVTAALVRHHGQLNIDAPRALEQSPDKHRHSDWRCIKIHGVARLDTDFSSFGIDFHDKMLPVSFFTGGHRFTWPERRRIDFQAP